ncbi:MAG: class I SAM-dependent methyltransferase [Ktedonobacteraceae bacterium]
MVTRSPSPFVKLPAIVWHELWRQDLLARSLIRHLGGLVPDGILDRGQVQTVLDVGCGTGAWARTLARAHPHLDVLGIDCDMAALDMACNLAFTHDIPNARFAVQDIQLLDESSLPPNHFEVIHLAFLAEALLTVDYAALANSLIRLLRPGGVLVWTEAELPLTLSAACEQLFALTLQAIDHAGQSFFLPDWGAPWVSLPGNGTLRRHLGITPMLGMWLRKAGYEQAQQAVAALEVSRGQPLHSLFVNAMLSFGRRIQPFLVQQQVISETECQQLREEVSTEVRRSDFCGMAYVLTISARKPVAVDCSSCQADVSSSQQEGKD